MGQKLAPAEKKIAPTGWQSWHVFATLHVVMVSEMGSLKGSVMRSVMRLVIWSVMGLVKRLVMRSVCLYNVKKCLELP